jgi:hypothetical protein
MNGIFRLVEIGSIQNGHSDYMPAPGFERGSSLDLSNCCFMQFDTANPSMIVTQLARLGMYKYYHHTMRGVAQARRNHYELTA